MERGFYNDEFEELLKQKADQYRMYPSEQVWKGINRSLHTRKKWYWLGFLLFISGIGYYAIDQLITPSNNKQQASVNKSATDHTTTDAVADREKARRQTAAIPFLGAIIQKGQRNDPAGTPRSFVTNPDNTFVGPTRIIIPPIPMTGNDPASNTNESMAEAGTTNTGKPKSGKPSLADRLAILSASDKDINTPIELNRLMLFKDLSAPPLEPEATPAPEVVPPKLTDAGLEADEQRINWMQQYAVYNLKVPKLKRLSWQLSFAPTMNYRKLTSNDASIPNDIKNLPVKQNVAGDPNKLVNHKPALGFELGSHFQYALTKNLQIRAGAQFNYSRYAIQAYGSNASEEATIALNSSSNGYTFDSLTKQTRISNVAGDVSENLQNQYFQLSLPVGFDYKVLSAGKLQIGLASTIQPTFLINRQSYLITTDYKNYTQEPSLVRRWNVNAGAEIYLAYKSGDLKWQIGPQFRYQLFSSYVDKYPIREYLMEYGLKIGVTKAIR
ncbi:outer membrane beta-barrel protein [Paraflavitalea pollutisoli]|uniref:outer membrane beta-barrel protein n=1 Tax=Paraflavitalea pollutisoli TaxID=3034143 RepID=UPI0023EE251E|nr:outer membrane beta-barrel protein [Paraflavitalea sp. H1-2-19X]